MALKNKTYQTLTTNSLLTNMLFTDVLIIGAGGAGLRAAIEAKTRNVNVLIVTKEYMGGAHTGMAMGGLNVAMKKPATPKSHYLDTINGGWGINNHKMARIFVREMPSRIYDLERFGVKFDKLPDGSFYTWAGGKQSTPLNLCAGDYTGREMMRGLVKEIRRLKIPYLENHFVTKLFINKKTVLGVFLIDLKTGKRKVINSKVTIIATGGAGVIYLINTNAPSNTGEGYTWALEAGAELVDMEMIQFHPTGIAYPKKLKGRLITEKARGHGGILKNKLGERFMARYHPDRMELAGRDEVARAIYQEIKEGRGTKNGGVYLDVTHWKKGQVKKIIPEVFSEFQKAGIDIRRQTMEVSPSMHHVMGGININEWGQTTLDGLLAVGEVTRNIHGANRLGGNSLSEGQVFGKRTGLTAAKLAKRRKIIPLTKRQIDEEADRIDSFFKGKRGISPKTILNKLQRLMWENVGLIRDGRRLKRALREIKILQKKVKLLRAANKDELRQCLELIEMLKVAETIVVCAILRTESRGAHYRTDYPQMMKKWVRNIVIYKGRGGSLKTRVVPIVKE